MVDDLVFPDGYSTGFSSDKPDGGEIDYPKLVWSIMQRLADLGCRLSSDRRVAFYYVDGVEQFGLYLRPYYDGVYNALIDELDSVVLDEKDSMLLEFNISSCSNDDDDDDVDISDKNKKLADFKAFLTDALSLKYAKSKHGFLIDLSARKNFLPGRKVGLSADEE